MSLEQYRRLAAVLHEEQVQSAAEDRDDHQRAAAGWEDADAVNLALTLSESYARRVLVIDADLRLPSLHTTLGYSQRPRPE